MAFLFFGTNQYLLCLGELIYRAPFSPHLFECFVFFDGLEFCVHTHFLHHKVTLCQDFTDYLRLSHPSGLFLNKCVLEMKQYKSSFVASYSLDDSQSMLCLEEGRLMDGWSVKQDSPRALDMSVLIAILK